MAPWLIGLIIVAVLCGFGWLVDAPARRRRKGLTKLTGPSSHPDPTVEVDRIVGGITQQAINHPHGSGL